MPSGAPGAPAGVMNTALACATCAQASIYAALQGKTGNDKLQGGAAPPKPPDAAAKPPDAAPPKPADPAPAPAAGAPAPPAPAPAAPAAPAGDKKPEEAKKEEPKKEEAKKEEPKKDDKPPAPPAGAPPAGGDANLPPCGPIPCKVVKDTPKTMQLGRANYHQQQAPPQ